MRLRSYGLGFFLALCCSVVLVPPAHAIWGLLGKLGAGAGKAAGAASKGAVGVAGKGAATGGAAVAGAELATEGAHAARPRRHAPVRARSIPAHPRPADSAAGGC